MIRLHGCLLKFGEPTRVSPTSGACIQSGPGGACLPGDHRATAHETSAHRPALPTTRRCRRRAHASRGDATHLDTRRPPTKPLERLEISPPNRHVAFRGGTGHKPEHLIDRRRRWLRTKLAFQSTTHCSAMRSHCASAPPTGQTGCKALSLVVTHGDSISHQWVRAMALNQWCQPIAGIRKATAAGQRPPGR